MIEEPENSHTYSEGSLAPCVLETLLHVYYRATPLSDSPAVRASVLTLERYGLITESAATLAGFLPTDRGLAHVAALLALPFPTPVSSWNHPLTGEPIQFTPLRFSTRKHP